MSGIRLKKGEGFLIEDFLSNDWLIVSSSFCIRAMMLMFSGAARMVIRLQSTLHVNWAKHKAIDVGACDFLDVKWRSSVSQFSQTLFIAPLILSLLQVHTRTFRLLSAPQQQPPKAWGSSLMP